MPRKDIAVGLFNEQKKKAMAIEQNPQKRILKEKASCRRIKAIGGFHMARRYVKEKALESEIFIMKQTGKTNREIREHFGLSKKQMTNLITRHNRREEKIEAGMPTRSKGRQRKKAPTAEKEKDIEIKRLRMENE